MDRLGHRKTRSAQQKQSQETASMGQLYKRVEKGQAVSGFGDEILRMNNQKITVAGNLLLNNLLPAE